MTEPPKPTARACQVIGASVTGAGHARRGQPGQDAWARAPEGGVGLPACVAVADGHGSPASFRSAVGARLAAEAAAEVTYRFLEAYRDAAPTQVKRTAEQWLPGEIVRRWTERVRTHAVENPVSPPELATLADSPGADRKLAENPLVPYGTTLLVAGVLDSCVVLLQLGDGDVLAVGPDGETVRPVPGDDRCFGGETPSLCQPAAVADFRCAFQSAAGWMPALIVLATDGYADCFAADADFLRVGTDLLALVRAIGPTRVERELPRRLEEASRRYSADDITVGIVCLADALAGGGESGPAV